MKMKRQHSHTPTHRHTHTIRYTSTHTYTSIQRSGVSDLERWGSKESEKPLVKPARFRSESYKPDGEYVFMEEDEVPKASSNHQERKDEDGGWTEVKDNGKEGTPAGEDEEEEKEEVVPVETIREVAIGKGLSGTLQLLKDRGTLKETVEWVGRNMDKKKSNLVGIYENDGSKEIRIERTDKYGRILTPKEAYRLHSHKFHGKEPGKGKQEKRMRKYQDELKVKQMKNADTPSLFVERMIETQARLKTPYLVLSGKSYETRALQKWSRPHTQRT